MNDSLLSCETKVVIAGNHDVVRDGISMWLEQYCCARVVGEAVDGYSTIKVCRNINPDILLMDLGLLRPSGKETFFKLRRIQPDLRIIVVSSENSAPDAFFLMSRGAFGFMTKQAKGAHFANTIRSVAMGYAVFPGEYIESFMEFRRNISRTGNLFGLSSREIEVLKACGEGVRTKDIAKQLCISVRTVETHRYSIYKKTNCNNISELPEVIDKVGLTVT